MCPIMLHCHWRLCLSLSLYYPLFIPFSTPLGPVSNSQHVPEINKGTDLARFTYEEAFEY